MVSSTCTAGWLRLVGDHLWIGHKAYPPRPYPNFPVCWAGEMLCAASVCSGQGTSFWKMLLERGEAYPYEKHFVPPFRGRDPGAMNVWCKYSSAHLRSRPGACSFWYIPHASGAWEEVALKQKYFFKTSQIMKKPLSFVQVQIKSWSLSVKELFLLFRLHCGTWAWDQQAIPSASAVSTSDQP